MHSRYSPHGASHIGYIPSMLKIIVSHRKAREARIEEIEESEESEESEERPW